MTIEHFILDADHQLVRCQDKLHWSMWMFGPNEEENRRVDYTHFNDNLYISTVFLGMDHQFGNGSPLFFETLIFGMKLDGEMWRCSTWEQAEQQHQRAVALVRQSFAGRGVVKA